MDKNLSRARVDNPDRRALGLALPVHHSPADWDYQAARGWHLSAEQYISAPTSLCRPVDNTQGDRGWVFLKEAISGNLSEGRYSTYVRMSASAYDINFWYYFRAQAKPTNNYPFNTYYAMRSANAWYIYKRVAGADAALTSHTAPTFAYNVWYQHRVTWYIWLTETLDPILRIVIDEYTAGAWLNYITWDIANPLWQDTPTNLIGMVVRGNSVEARTYIDNTLIYRRSA